MTKFETKPGVRIPKPQDARPRRFYTEVTIVPGADGFAIQLDGRSLRTPMKRAMALPAQDLADAVAQEWRDQGERIDPPSMPLTRLANVVIDQAAARRAMMIAEVLKYAETDLLRHRAETPPDLVDIQTRVWTPFLDWAGEALGAHLPTIPGILPAETRSEALEALRARAQTYDDWQLTVLAQATSLTGSAVLGFALVEGRADGETIFAASRIDEDFQISQWGEDAEAAEAAAILERETLACARLLAAL